MPKNFFSFFRPQGGFTLMELLVVLAVLGFLLAMVAPRLAGVTSSSAQTATETNMDRLLDMVTNSLQKTGKYPTGMINIVSVDSSTGEYHKPQISDRDPDTPPEVLGFEMDQRHKLFIHYLDHAEADELRKLGILYVYNYNSPFDRLVTASSQAMQPVNSGVAVLMTGGGANSTGVFQMDWNESDRTHPDELFRMVFGLGPETSLIKDGMIFNPSTCPQSTVKPSLYEWKWYSLLLPRLKATENRLRAINPLSATNGTVTAYAARGTQTAAQLATAARRAENVYARQHHSFFVLLDSEGNTRPNVAMDGWGLDLDNNGAIE